MYALIRIDTRNYGNVISRHRTPEAAEKALERKCAAVTRKHRYAITSLMYTTTETEAKVGDRVRI